MVTLCCVIAGAKVDAFSIDIDTTKTVDNLKDAIQKKQMYQFPANEMYLFLANKNGTWLSSTDPDVISIQHGSIPELLEGKAMNPTTKIGDLFGDAPTENSIHVLVVVPEHASAKRQSARNEDLPPPKRVKTERVEVVYQGPVPEEFYSVPMESIGTFQMLQTAFLTRSFPPLCLLYGPRQFGKTTITHRLRKLLAADPSVLAIYISLNPIVVKSETSFWRALGWSIGEEMTSFDEFQVMVQRSGKRLWLAIDEMDAIFENEELTSNFMQYLRTWQSSSQAFVGFLGIGTSELLSMPMKLKRGKISPFNLAEVFQVEPFTTDQMNGFFTQIEGRYRFRDSTRQAIMEYSAGAPGVFGSLIRFSIDHDKYDKERHEWEHWFKIENFSLYRNRFVQKIWSDLQQLTESDYELLELVIKDDDGGNSAKLSSNREKLLQMGVFTTESGNSELRFSSEMMRRLCQEAIPIRKTDFFRELE